MANFADLCVRPNMDENKTRLLISSEKPAEVASPYALSTSVPEVAKNGDKEFKKIDQSHGEVLEKSWKLISCGNRSSSRMIALQGDKNDADCIGSNDSECGMHEDLVFYIMLWLPVASLLRFRSVCRLWRSLIDSSTFVAQHYNHNSNKNCLLARHMLPSSDGDYDFKFCLLSGNKYEVYSNLDYEQPWYSVDEITILNSCNGIVLLINEKSGDNALWNPATKQLRPLPESSMSHLCRVGVGFGFGFDAKSNDYKVVKIGDYHYEKKLINLVEVYSLRTDSWRTINKDEGLRTYCSKIILKNGVCFWTGRTDTVSPILIYFDLNNEVFETMPLPGKYHSLVLLKDKLCCITAGYWKPQEINAGYFEIWILDEYGVKESWKKICTIGPLRRRSFLPSAEILGFSKNGELLLLGFKYGHGELYLSNFDAREGEHLELQNPGPSPSMSALSYNKLQNPNPVISKFVCYNESLVSLKREDDGTYK